MSHAREPTMRTGRAWLVVPSWLASLAFHTGLLAAGIPVCEHLTGLDELPTTGSLFSAAPVAVVGMGTFPVRAWALVPAAEVREPSTGGGHGL